jgi:transposase-like protein
MSKRKVPLAAATRRDLEAERLSRLPGSATLSLAELASSVRDGLMAFCCTAGLLVVGQMMDEEMTERIGPKGRHLPDRVGTRNGTAAGFAVLGGRSVPIRRPRATEVGGGEVHLDSYEVFSATDLMTEMAVERMLAGVSTRRHRLVAESLGEAIEEAARGDSKSAVSRRFVNATAAKLDELVHRDLSTLDVAVLMIDGIVFAKCCCVVAIVVTTDGTKVPVGLFEGDTENATVVTDLLADLVERGLDATKGILCVLDGSKALASGVRRVFGKQALVQRCTIHKRRNVSDYLPKELAQAADDKLARAFNDADTARGLKVAKGVAAQLERQHPSAAASIREGLEEMFTVRRLGVPDRLARTMTTTNAVESMISVVKSLVGRVKNWRDATMVRRWVGTGMLEAERSFRRVRGCKDMAVLVTAVRAEVAHRLGNEKTTEAASAVA